MMLQDVLAGSPYLGYSYSYPHKTAYRPLQPAVPLKPLWAAERRDALFLYLHVPFCEMRCAFCNLFTQTRPGQGLSGQYLAALRRQAVRVRETLNGARFVRLAVGGGTPTYLEAGELQELLAIAEDVLGVKPHTIPVAVETSPGTAQGEKLAILREKGVTRISLGVQSFIEAETAAAGRPQKNGEVVAALERIRAHGFPTLNIDLIYGLPGQTVASWLESVRTALHFAPEELYLYPLYVRPLTGLGCSRRRWDDVRLTCYREGRALLRSAGYTQVSMRMFRAAHAPAEDGPVYCCQEDGMVGLGCGARSYTRALHYSGGYAVRPAGVRTLIAEYVARPEEEFDRADYGFRLDPGEQRRRYAIQSLLSGEGLGFAAYERRFGSAAADDLPELAGLQAHGFALRTPEGLRLTETGLERSDAIGPWLYSGNVRELMGGFEWR